MIGILGGMGTQAGLDFCNKLAILNRGKIDQEYPLFILYNKSNIPGRPESIGVQTKNLSNKSSNNTSKKKYNDVLKSLLHGCKLLEKNKCKFIVIPCNTAHYWFDDLQKKINIPIVNMPKEVFKFTKKNCKKNSKVGLLATEGTLKTGVYDKIYNKSFKLIQPSQNLQKKSVNRAIKLVKMGNVKAAAKAIKPAINELIKMKCKKIILGCTELPIAIFAFKSFSNVKSSKIFLDPNLILANSAMTNHNRQFMSADKDKPYVLRVAELIYLKVAEIKKENSEMDNIQAFEIFMTTKDYDLISSGEFHDKWFLELKNNKFVDKITGKKINDETMRLLEMQKDSMIKFLLKIPKLYYAKSHFPLEISQRAFDHLWRVCESYEMWCKETKQEKLITLQLLN